MINFVSVNDISESSINGISIGCQVGDISEGTLFLYGLTAECMGLSTFQMSVIYS